MKKQVANIVSEGKGTFGWMQSDLTSFKKKKRSPTCQLTDRMAASLLLVLTLPPAAQKNTLHDSVKVCGKRSFGLQQ